MPRRAAKRRYPRRRVGLHDSLDALPRAARAQLRAATSQTPALASSRSRRRARGPRAGPATRPIGELLARARPARSASTPGTPSVSVPVLSSNTVRAPPSRSIAPPPLTITPTLAARETPATKAIGAARINGHGVATTSTANARTASPLSAHARPAIGSVSGRKRRRSGRPSARRGALGLGLAHESHERRVCAVGGAPGGAQLERVAALEVPLRTAAPAARAPGATRRSGGLVDGGPRADHGRPSARSRRRARRRRRRPRPLDGDLLHPSAAAGARPRSALHSAVSSRRARRPAAASSALPPASISAITAPARYSPSASAPAIASSAMTSTPTSPRRRRARHRRSGARA